MSDSRPVKMNKSKGDRVFDQFNKMYRRKAFVHWYTREGLELSEFERAHEGMMDLLNEYAMIENDSLKYNNDIISESSSECNIIENTKQKEFA